MSGEAVTVAVRILDLEYQVSCTKEQVDELLESARDVSTRMEEIRASGRVFGLDRIAVMAALNLAHDNLRQRRRLSNADREVGRLTTRIGRIVDEHKPGT